VAVHDNDLALGPQQPAGLSVLAPRGSDDRSAWLRSAGP